jgi:hypothetical protein
MSRAFVKLPAKVELVLAVAVQLRWDDLDVAATPPERLIGLMR